MKILKDEKENVFLLPAIAFAFAACSNDESIQDEDPGSLIKGESALLSISVIGKRRARHNLVQPEMRGLTNRKLIMELFIYSIVVGTW